MSSEEAKRYVSAGLERRKAERNDREIQLEDQARQLRLTINDNHTARTLTDAQKRAKVKAERLAKAKARKDKENASILAVQNYARVCIGIILATLLTPFPWWAAIVLTAGLAVFPMAYIYRLEVRG